MAVRKSEVTFKSLKLASFHSPFYLSLNIHHRIIKIITHKFNNERIAGNISSAQNCNVSWREI